MKLHVAPPSPRAIKVLATMNHLGIDVDVEPLDLLNGENMRPAFAALNPNRLMPVLEDDGFVLWESNAIMQYLASKRADQSLWPSDPRKQADVSRWQCWELAHWGRACSTILFERFVKRLFGQGDPNPAEVERAEQEFHRFAQVLNDHLKGRDWLVGQGITLADMTVGAWMTYAAQAHYPLEPFPEITRWYERLEAVPAWKKATASLIPMPA